MRIPNSKLACEEEDIPWDLNRSPGPELKGDSPKTHSELASAAIEHALESPVDSQNMIFDMGKSPERPSRVGS